VGGYAAAGDASFPDDERFDMVNFRIPLPSIPDGVHFIPAGQSTTDCPGPGQAAAGQLCLYEKSGSNVQGVSEFDPAIASAGVETWGFAVLVQAASPGFFDDVGTWAVTAA
jgi:hypothetical protein